MMHPSLFAGGLLFPAHPGLQDAFGFFQLALPLG
jgi:hypothetical protein